MSKPCVFCTDKNARKQCAKCKVHYCAQKCADLDWQQGHHMVCVGGEYHDEPIMQFARKVQNQVMSIIYQWREQSEPLSVDGKDPFYISLKWFKDDPDYEPLPYGMAFFEHHYAILTELLLPSDKKMFVETYVFRADDTVEDDLGILTLYILYKLSDFISRTAFQTPHLYHSEEDEEEYPLKNAWNTRHGGLQNVWKYIYPFHVKTGERLTFLKELSIDIDQNVYLAREEKTDVLWVVKWDREDTVLKEIANYKRIQKYGGKIPNVKDTKWMAAGKPVLVIEKLDKLDLTDDEYEIGVQLLETQFPYLHQFAVHADLKPDNIMKRPGTREYFIIDMDLTTEKVVGNCYERTHWTPYFHYDPFYPRTLCTYRVDLLELRAVMIALMQRRGMQKTKARMWVVGGFESSQRELIALFKENKTEPMDLLTFLATKDRPAWTRNNHMLVTAYQNVLHGYCSDYAMSEYWKYVYEHVALGTEPTLSVYRELADILKRPASRKNREDDGNGV
jgi:hypothetical protein